MPSPPFEERTRYRTIAVHQKTGRPPQRLAAKKRIDPRKRRFSIVGAGGLASKLLWWQYDPLFQHRAAISHKGLSVRVPGILHGMRKKTYLRYLKDGNREARKLLRIMTEKKIFVPDNNVSEEAMEAILTVLRAPANARDKITAAKALLEYTQKKPVQATETTLNTAESFLDAILAEEKNEARASRATEEAEGQLSSVCEVCPEDTE